MNAPQPEPSEVLEKNPVTARQDLIARIRTKFPHDLTGASTWCLWKYVTRGEKTTKLPYQTNGSPAESNNPETWSTLDAVCTEYLKGKFEGIGCFIAKPFVAVDFDHVRNKDTGEIELWAEQAIKDLNSYTELSPSGTGFHVWCYGTVSGSGKKRGRVEIYAEKRYFTVTALTVEKFAFPLSELPSAFYTAIEKLDPQYKTSAPAEIKNERVTKSQKIHHLSKGDWKSAGFPSQSEADCAWCVHLAEVFGGEPQTIDSEFRKSPLMREKWDVKHGPDTYGNMTISKALVNFKQGVVVPELVTWELHELITAKIPPREALATLESGTPILTTNSINQVVAWRGSGKTLFQQGWGIALSCGEDFLCYKTMRPLRVLYVEGELPDAQLQERLSALSSGKTIPRGNFNLLSRDRQIASGVDIPSIHTAEGRLAIERQIDALRIEVLFLDSISSLLLLGTNEEENWLEVLPWLSRLRSRGLCILITQQTGKNQTLGNRGHSRSEDPLDLSIKLTPRDEEGDHLNCKLEYTKIRAQRRGVRSLNIEYKAQGWVWTLFDQDLVDALRLLLEESPEMSNVKLAQELGIGRNRIPGLKKKVGTVVPKQSKIPEESAA